MARDKFVTKEQCSVLAAWR